MHSHNLHVYIAQWLSFWLFQAIKGTKIGGPAIPIPIHHCNGNTVKTTLQSRAKQGDHSNQGQ